MPKQVLHYANEKERQQLIDDLSDETVLNTILLKSGSSGEYDIKFPTGGSASLPQAVLLQKAEEACHKAILGQTLTSDTSAHGGSLAPAKVHAGVQADVVMKIAESVADILNQQLVPAILQANFGRVQGLPIPELRCKLPQAVASIERAQFLKTALEIPGMKVTKTEAYEYLNLTQPSDTDEVFEAQDPNAMGGGPGGGGFPGGGMGAGFPGGGKEAELPDAGAKDEVVTSAKAPAAPRDRNEAIKAWLSPLKKKLEDARSSGASLSDIRAQISEWKPDPRALAGALADNIANGLQGRTRGNEGAANGNTEEVAAENPYGCNQHGHGWVDPCPYGGGGSNGMAGKSALQIAGGAENVNPDPDDDEEEKEYKERKEKEQEKLHGAAKRMSEAISGLKASQHINAIEEMHAAAEEFLAERRQEIGDENYFKENNNPAKVLPKGIDKKIDANPTKLYEEGQKRFSEYVTGLQPVMAIDFKKLSSILNERGGRFLNCWEVFGGIGHGNVYYAEGRNSVEREYTGEEELLSTSRPVYAFLSKSVEKPSVVEDGMYGSLRVSFKPEVRNRCTFSGRDSLNGFLDADLKGVTKLNAPTKGNCLTKEQIDHINKGGDISEIASLGGDGYMEAQIYGPLTANDVASIGISKRRGNPLKMAETLRKKLGQYNKNVIIEETKNYYIVKAR
jgi:hypothetical protein